MKIFLSSLLTNNTDNCIIENSLGRLVMENYRIKKITNGEYKETEKKFTLNVSKYCSNKSVLYFDVEGEEIPTCFDVELFYNIMVARIQAGLVESMKYENGCIFVEFKDGNILKKYVYDFAWEKFSRDVHTGAVNAANELKEVLYKLVSLWNENPDKAITNKQKSLRVVFDILDGERVPVYEKEEDLLEVFEAYNQNKTEILKALLDNVVFFDEDENPIFYPVYTREKKLKEITYDVISQMETSMLLFAANNNAVELYQKYLASTYIPRRELVYRFVDENGEEQFLTPEEVEALDPEATEGKLEPVKPENNMMEERYGMAREQLQWLKDLLLAGANTLSEKLDEMGRTKL